MIRTKFDLNSFPFELYLFDQNYSGMDQNSTSLKHFIKSISGKSSKIKKLKGCVHMANSKVIFDEVGTF